MLSFPDVDPVSGPVGSAALNFPFFRSFGTGTVFLRERRHILGISQCLLHREARKGGVLLSLWRNGLARSAVNRKVGGSSPPRDGGRGFRTHSAFFSVLITIAGVPC